MRHPDDAVDRPSQYGGPGPPALTGQLLATIGLHVEGRGIVLQPRPSARTWNEAIEGLRSREGAKARRAGSLRVVYEHSARRDFPWDVAARQVTRIHLLPSGLELLE